MKYDELNLQKLRELPIFDVCTKLGITLYGMGPITKRAKCWYHDDQHPSMHVNKKKNIFKCFVCGKGGDVIRLVQDYDNKTFVEACDWLVNEFHVVLIEDKPLSAGNSSKFNSKLNNSDQFPCEAGSKSVDPSIPKSVIPLDATLVAKSLSLDSQFCKSVVPSGYLSESQLRHTASRYRLGCSKDGGVVFWQIDDHQQVHAGKIMYYLSDCHRDKEHHPTWVHCLMKDKLPANYEFHPCLFGLHLLTMEQPTAGNSSKFNSKLNNSGTNSEQFPCEAGKKIAIVESEKSAVILSEKFPDFVWLSCGGLQAFKPHLLAPLVHYKVIIFPDTDPTGDAFRQWCQVASEAQHLYKFRYPLRVSPLLETHATLDQKQRKIDLVDYLFCVQTP